METPDLIKQLSQDKKPVQPLASIWMRFVQWSLIALLCVGTAVLVMGVRADLKAILFTPAYFLQLIATLALALLSSLSAFTLSIPGKKSVPLLLTTTLTLLGWLAIIGHFAYHGGDYAAPLGYVCTRDILLMALLPGAVLFWMIQQGAVLTAAIAGLFTILSAAALSALGVQLICACNKPLHILYWHFLPVLFFGLCGMLIGKVLLRWKN